MAPSILTTLLRRLKIVSANSLSVKGNENANYSQKFLSLSYNCNCKNETYLKKKEENVKFYWGVKSSLQRKFHVPNEKSLTHKACI